MRFNIIDYSEVFFVELEEGEIPRQRDGKFVLITNRSLAAVQPVEVHLPLFGQAELSAPSVHVGRVDFVAADLQHAGNVTEVLLGTAFAVIPQPAKDHVLRSRVITAAKTRRGSRYLPARRFWPSTPGHGLPVPP